MRINLTECLPLGDQGGWACESMTYEDATSSLLGALELDVLHDAVIKEPFYDRTDGTTLYFTSRTITGQVAEYLPLWPKFLHAIFNKDVTGISFPEEGKVFLKGQVGMTYEANGGYVEITVLETTTQP